MGLELLDGEREFHTTLSVMYCTEHFGAYGGFATLPLCTALLANGVSYTNPWNPPWAGGDYFPRLKA